MAKRGRPKKLPDPAIVRLVRALAKQAAREDHEKENSQNFSDEHRKLESILD
jgi:hypothetical protein